MRRKIFFIFILFLDNGGVFAKSKYAMGSTIYYLHTSICSYDASSQSHPYYALLLLRGIAVSALRNAFKSIASQEK